MIANVACACISLFYNYYWFGVNGRSSYFGKSLKFWKVNYILVESWNLIFLSIKPNIKFFFSFSKPYRTKSCYIVVGSTIILKWNQSYLNLARSMKNIEIQTPPLICSYSLQKINNINISWCWSYITWQT